MTRRNYRSALRKRRAVPLHRFDKLPPELRRWLQQAALPWSVAQAERIWAKAMRESGGNRAQALARLDRAQASAIARDAPAVWGDGYPAPH